MGSPRPSDAWWMLNAARAYGVRLATRPETVCADGYGFKVIASLLVVAGIPASGKSTFCRDLRKRGFSYFTLNGEDDALRTEPSQQAAFAAYSQNDIETLLVTLKSAPTPTVVEFGFPPDD